jgi:hypothetical protein
METDSAPEAALEPRRSAQAVRLRPRPSAPCAEQDQPMRSRISPRQRLAPRGLAFTSSRWRLSRLLTS